MACEQGLYERDVLWTILGLLEPESWYFDIGANIGLLSVPVLKKQPSVTVMSYEPSPDAAKCLQRTHANSPYRERWHILTKAFSNRSGTAQFHLSPEGLSVYDGLKHTQRVAEAATVVVDVTTVDDEWKRLGRPRVSVIKCDVEGGELQVFEGATECLRQARPCIVTEWNAGNFRAYGEKPEFLLDFARQHAYTVHAVPSLVQVTSPRVLRAHMMFTESFVLLPET